MAGRSGLWTTWRVFACRRVPSGMAHDRIGKLVDRSSGWPERLPVKHQPPNTPKTPNANGKLSMPDRVDRVTSPAT